MLRPEYLAKKLTPYPLPTKDGGVLRTIGDAHAYILALRRSASSAPAGSTPVGYFWKKLVRQR
jgi:hypothetical protein